MSNLGWYQKLTTAAKAVGRPQKLVGLIIVFGAVIGAGGTVLIQKTVRAVNSIIRKEKTQHIENEVIYEVHTEAIDSNELTFIVGDKYKMLNRDKDSILIEKIGDANNPYFVSAEFMKKISDFFPDE